MRQTPASQILQSEAANNHSDAKLVDIHTDDKLWQIALAVESPIKQNIIFYTLSGMSGNFVFHGRGLTPTTIPE